jgi:hypothetical protein
MSWLNRCSVASRAWRPSFHQLQHLLLKIVPMAVEGREERVDGVAIIAWSPVEVLEIMETDLLFEFIKDEVREGIDDLFVHCCWAALMRGSH